MRAHDQLYATCASGLQTLLAAELKALGINHVNTAGAGVRFGGGLKAAYEACLWSRVANRVLLHLASGDADSPETLYELVQTLDWSAHLKEDGSLAVDFFSAQSEITHSQYGALKVKDAIVDQFREKSGRRPDVDRDTPDVRVNVYVHKNKARIALDLSGASLHRRGYRQQAGPAPLKENLAAALLLECNWPHRVTSGDAFVDPMCGSGTLVIEAAMMACKIAPGLTREYNGFDGWLGHDESMWAEVKNAAVAARIASPVALIGADSDARALDYARQNAVLADLGSDIQFIQQDIRRGAVDVSQVANANAGLLVSNPPYGERLATDKAFYTELGEGLSRYYPGWSFGLFSALSAPMKEARLPANRTLNVRNGGIDCALYTGDVPTSLRPKQGAAASAVKDIAQCPEEFSETGQLSGDAATDVDAQPFINRLKKNEKHLRSWIKREGLRAYRLYDADVPEFAVAVDVYDCDSRHVVVHEYQAPRTVNTVMAQARLKAVMKCLPALLNVDKANIHLKLREKQSGLAQYEKQAGQGVKALLEEQGCQFEVNLSDYLDTGLFLDHRLVRRYIQDNAKGLRFLNLFAYTASMSVAAAVGGASTSLSLDLSNRYCQWAMRNLQRNNCDTTAHTVLKQDVMGWLKNASKAEKVEFDFIFLDPPTFSNSTGVDADWNVQRDHESCIRQCMDLLASDGLLIFSNNYRRFKLSENLSSPTNAKAFKIEDRSRWSIDKDFQRNARIHNCWFIKHS